MTDVERRQIGALFQQVIIAATPEAACHWPATLSVFLVAQGNAAYDGGNFWGSVCATTDLPVASTSIWGQCFEDFLVEADLWNARELDSEGALRYVAKILAHGGIPRCCQEELFEFLVSVSIGDTSDRASVVLDEWRFAPQALDELSQPIRRFLLYGHRLAEDYIERCLDLMSTISTAQEPPDAEALGLPEDFVARFQEWWLGRTEGTTTTGRTRWLLPRLLFAPFDGNGPVLDLPEQAIDPIESADRAVWSVAPSPSTIRRPVGLYRRGTRLLTEHERISVMPATGYRVSVTCGGIEHSWFVPGLEAGGQVIAFDSQTSLRVSLKNLNVTSIWLIHQIGTTVSLLTIDGQITSAVRSTEIPSLRGTWAGFAATSIDLSAADSLILERGSSRHSFRIVRDENRRPVFCDGEQVPLVANAGDLPIYSTVPFMRVVGIATKDPKHLSLFSISVQPAARTTTASDAFVCLANIREELTLSENGCDIPLARLMGPEHLGEMLVRLRGPLGREARLRFIHIPGLQISNHLSPIIRMPSEDPQPFQFFIELPESSSCRGEGNTSCRRELIGPRYVITMVGSGASAQVSIVHESGIIVPIRIRCRRLVFSFAGLARSRGETGTIRTTFEELAQSPPELSIYLPPNPLPERLALQLQLRCGEKLIQQDETSLTTSGSGCARFSLRDFLESLRQGERFVQRFALLVQGAGVNAIVPLLRCEPSAGFDDVDVEIGESATDWEIHASWHQQKPTPDRVLRLWPLSRPWLGPHIEPINESATLSWKAHVDKALLPPGRYMLEIGTDDGWSTEIPMRPRPSSANVCSCEINSTNQTAVHEPSCLTELANLLIGHPDDHQLQRICDLASERDAAGLIEALLAVEDLLSESFNFVSLQLPELRRLYRMLGERPESLLIGLAESCSRGCYTQDRLIAMVMHAGLLQKSIDGQRLGQNALGRIWELWPPLGLIAESGSLARRDVAAWRRAGVALGVGTLDSIRDDDIVSALGESEWLREAQLMANQEAANSSPSTLRFLKSMQAPQTQMPLTTILAACPDWIRAEIERLAGSAEQTPWRMVVLIAGCQRAAAVLPLPDANRSSLLMARGLQSYYSLRASYALALVVLEARIALRRRRIEEAS